MNIYDFDNTIFKGDSSIKFIKYSLLRHPFLVLVASLKSLGEVIKYIFKKSDFEKIKGKMFSFVKRINNLDELAVSNYYNFKIRHLLRFTICKELV